MKTGSDYQPSLSFGLLLKGKPKTGKTTLGMSFPNVYVADCDNNLGGAVRRLRELFPSKEFRYDTINVAEDGTVVPPEKRWPRLVECLTKAAQDPWVQTMLVDSIFAVDQYLQDFIVSEKPAGKDHDKMTISDWIPYRNMMTKFITRFRSYRKFFIVTAHEIAEKDELSGQISYKISMSSKLQDNFGGFFSDEWICEANTMGDQVEYTVKCTPTPNRSAGASLDLPMVPFKFQWETFAKRLAKFNETMKGKVA